MHSEISKGSKQISAKLSLKWSNPYHSIYLADGKIALQWKDNVEPKDLDLNLENCRLCDADLLALAEHVPEVVRSAITIAFLGMNHLKRPIAILEKMQLHRLKYLSLKFNPLESIAGSAFPSTPGRTDRNLNFPNLETLHLEGCGLDAQSISGLRSVVLPKLKLLLLSNNKLGKEGIRNLLGESSEKNPFPQLEELHLDGCQLDDEALSIFALHRFDQLRTLNLSENRFTHTGLRNLSYRSYPELAVLQLNACELDKHGIKELAKMYLPWVYIVDLEKNRLDSAALDELSQWHLPNLQSLQADVLGEKWTHHELLSRMKYGPSLWNRLGDFLAKEVARLSDSLFNVEARLNQDNGNRTATSCEFQNEVIQYDPNQPLISTPHRKDNQPASG